MDAEYAFFRIDKLTCDLLTVKMVSKSCVTWATSVTMLIFHGLSVLELFSMHATDRRQRMYAELERNPQNGTGLGHHPPCSWGVPDTIEMCPFTHVLILLPDQTVREILSKSAWKMWPLASRLSRSIKVIRTDTDRSATHDFLLMYRTNHGLISSCVPFPRKRRFQLKINFYTRLSNAPRRRYPLVIWYRRVYGQEDGMVALPYRERTSTISSAVWIQYTNVTDGRTPADCINYSSS